MAVGDLHKRIPMILGRNDSMRERVSIEIEIERLFLGMNMQKRWIIKMFALPQIHLDFLPSGPESYYFFALSYLDYLYLFIYILL